MSRVPCWLYTLIFGGSSAGFSIYFILLYTVFYLSSLDSMCVAAWLRLNCATSHGGGSGCVSELKTNGMECVCVLSWALLGGDSFNTGR